jgi:hypothetical protein
MNCPLVLSSVLSVGDSIECWPLSLRSYFLRLVVNGHFAESSVLILPSRPSALNSFCCRWQRLHSSELKTRTKYIESSKVQGANAKAVMPRLR